MNEKVKGIRSGVFFICLAALAGLGLATAFLVESAVAQPQATTIQVTATDGGVGGPECRLRDALRAANLEASVGGCLVTGAPPYIIELGERLVYTLTVADNPGALGANGLPVVANDIQINGNHSAIERYRNMGDEPAFRIFQVALTGTLRLVDVSVVNGGRVILGGGLYNLGTAELEGGNFFLNRAADGAAVYNGGTMTATSSLFNVNYGGCGGAIANDGKLSLYSSRVIANFADT